MNDAPDSNAEAARQTWWAASCVLALAVLVGVVNLIAPGWSYGTQGFGVALGVAGFVVTRLLLAEPPRWRGGLNVLARAALWGVPPLVLVCAAVLIAGLFLLPPADLHNQAWTALWTAVGASGGELMKQGAWTPATSSELLLHGWIIGMATQLTVGWTVVVVVLRVVGARRWIGWVALVGVIVAIAVQIALQVRGAGPQAFYLAPARAEMFLIGALIALRRWPFAGQVMARPIAMLAGAGRFALPFWLWVWPLLALPRLILARPLEPLEIVAALAAAAGLAVLTVRGVQRPLWRRLGDKPLYALVLCGGALAVVAVASAVLFAADGLPARVSAAVRAEEAAVLVRPPLQTRCHMEGPVLPDLAACTVPGGAAADVVLWGNSHASHLSPALLAWAEPRGQAVRQATMSGCLPLVRRGSGLVSGDCDRFNRLAIAEWGRVRPKLLLIGAGWTAVLEREPGDDQAQLEMLVDDLTLEMALLRAGVGPETRIVLLGNTPDYGFAPGACHARQAFLRLDTGRCDLTRPQNAALMAAMDAELARIAASVPGVSLYRPSDALCADGLCRTRGQGGVWYSDQSHMTEAGGQAQVAALSAVLDRAMAAR